MSLHSIPEREGEPTGSLLRRSTGSTMQSIESAQSNFSPHQPPTRTAVAREIRVQSEMQAAEIQDEMKAARERVLWRMANLKLAEELQAENDDAKGPKKLTKQREDPRLRSLGKFNPRPRTPFEKHITPNLFQSR